MKIVMEQENFSYEQQKKQELREHDADFARIIASRLNQLIDDEVLTVEDVEKASHDILDEFLFFSFHYEIIDNGFSDKRKGKIRRFFKGESVERVDIKERGPVKEQYVDMMREIFEALQRLSPHVMGMILLGSRMGDYADGESDCDFKLDYSA